MISDINAVARYLEKQISDFTDIAVVGVSGGVDSSVVASLCVTALGKERVHLVSMPYDEIDTSSFNARSQNLATLLGAQHHTISIYNATQEIQKSLVSAFSRKELAKLTLANIRPRVRMNILYSICGELGYQSKMRSRVIGTGHLSEDLIGYDTKGGDALCDLFILSDLVKSEVYQLASYYNVPKDIIDAPPSAGLYPDQTDAEELGYSYDELEGPTLALFQLLQTNKSLNELTERDPVFDGYDPKLVHFVVSKYRQNYHKHKAPLTVRIRDRQWFI